MIPIALFLILAALICCIGSMAWRVPLSVAVLLVILERVIALWGR